MKKLLETLYITTPESYLFERNGNICISIGGAERASVPITQVDSIGPVWEKYALHRIAILLLSE